MISDTKKKRRWRHFALIRKRNPNTPANVAMGFYFDEKCVVQRRKARITLLAILNKTCTRLTVRFAFRGAAPFNAVDLRIFSV